MSEYYGNSSQILDHPTRASASRVAKTRPGGVKRHSGAGAPAVKIPIRGTGTAARPPVLSVGLGAGHEVSGSRCRRSLSPEPEIAGAPESHGQEHGAGGVEDVLERVASVQATLAATLLDRASCYLLQTESRRRALREARSRRPRPSSPEHEGAAEPRRSAGRREAGSGWRRPSRRTPCR